MAYPKVRTQWFRAAKPPVRVGRYLALPEGKPAPVFRYWNGQHWQYNRRKVAQEPHFGSRPDDLWAGMPR